MAINKKILSTIDSLVNKDKIKDYDGMMNLIIKNIFNTNIETIDQFIDEFMNHDFSISSYMLILYLTKKYKKYLTHRKRMYYMTKLLIETDSERKYSIDKLLSYK